MVSTGKRVLALLLAALLLASTAVVALASQPQDAYVNDDDINVRTGPGTSYSLLAFKGENIRLFRGQYVQILGSATSGSAVWYQVRFKYYGRDQIGYMHSDYVTKLERDEAFEAHMTEQGFPESYKPYLRALYTAFGKKWTFLAYHTGLDWEDSVNMESILGVSLIDGSDTTLRSKATGAYDSATGTWKQYEKGWYAASRETVACFLDPRNYLIDGTCIAFEAMKGNPTLTYAQVASILSDCAWATPQIIQEFLQAGQEADVNAIYLANKAKKELGTGSTTNASGFDYNGTTVYNFFNVGAYSSAPDPNYAGMTYAYEHGWTTSYKAILGGAQFIYENYIADGQNTQYLQRFNLTDQYTYTYQYATDIRYAFYGGWADYKAYRNSGAGLLDTNLTLSIPVLDNMPEQPAAIPTEEETPDEPVYNYAESLGLQVSDSYISGFTLGTTGRTLVSQIQGINAHASVTVRDKNGNILTDSAIGTGATITITDATGTMTYTVVIYGDVNGDGQIGATDLLWVKRHILGTSTLSGAHARAATLANGQIGATSLLTIKRHILGSAYIAQK